MLKEACQYIKAETAIKSVKPLQSLAWTHAQTSRHVDKQKKHCFWLLNTTNICFFFYIFHGQPPIRHDFNIGIHTWIIISDSFFFSSGSRQSAKLNSTTQHAVSRKLGGKRGIMCFNNRFPLPSLLFAV